MNVVTVANRLVYSDVVAGDDTDISAVAYSKNGRFSIGQNAITLNLQSLKLANGLYYVIIRLPDGSKAVGKLVIIR